METFELSVVIIGMLFVASLLAGFIDTLVGGGGLIVLPALMAAGIPPILALGTNKLQAVAGTATATASLVLRGKISLSQIRLPMVAAFGGALLGSLLVQTFDAGVLNFVIPCVIVAIAIYFLISPKLALTPRDARFSSAKYAGTAVPAVGFYDGMFGPGTGSFFVLSGVSLRGHDIVRSTMDAKALNFATNLAALMVFVAFGKVLWVVGGIMMLGQFIGASLGARMLLQLNPGLLRYLVISMCFLILVAWGVDNYV